MLQNKIYKYFTIEIFKTFVTILFAFTAIAWTVRAVSFLDLIVENGHSITTYLLFSFLNISNILTKFIPLSFLLALILSILKFERQNELILLWTSGLNKIRIINLFFKISLLVLILQIFFAVFITPNALNKSRELIRSSDFNSISSIIKENDFSDSFDNITFYIEKKTGQNEMENIFIRDDSAGAFNNLLTDSKDNMNSTIIAKRGVITNKKLILIDGLIQNQNKKGELNNINFSKTEISIDAFTPRTIIVPKLQETPTSSLIYCVASDYYNLRSKEIVNCPEDISQKKSVVEMISRRIGMPIYIPLVALISCFLLISNKEKKYKFFDKYIYFIISFIILILAEVLVRFSGFSNLNTITYFFLPIILMPLIYLILFKKLLSEKVRQ